MSDTFTIAVPGTPPVVEAPPTVPSSPPPVIPAGATPTGGFLNDERTLLEQLTEAVTADVSRDDIIVPVPARPGVTLRVSPNITDTQIKAWRRNSGANSKTGMDAIKFGAYVIGNTTKAILINNEEVTEDGEPINFASDAIATMTGEARWLPEGIRAFFGIDPHIETAAILIMEEAGYGDEIEAQDPTKS
jgi:hypothetical protein